MRKITIFDDTTVKPITTIGKYAGVCYNANTDEEEKNFKRGLNCLKTNHGRTLETPHIYFTLEGYSAKVIRELYTHIGGAPTRLQASTRYIDYANKGMPYIIPPTIAANEQAKKKYEDTMNLIQESAAELEGMGIPKEDASMLLPLGMESTVVYVCNLRTLIDMSHQRMCSRAFWEFRILMLDLIKALQKYGAENGTSEWQYITDNYFKPKCEVLGHCPEAKGCGRKPN